MKAKEKEQSVLQKQFIKKSTKKVFHYAEEDCEDNILFNGKEYLCRASADVVFYEESNGEKACGFPVQPYKAQIDNDGTKFIVDACDIIWSYDKWHDGREYFKKVGILNQIPKTFPKE